MRLLLCLDEACLRSWHLDLAQRLRALCEVTVAIEAAGPARSDAGLDSILRLDASIQRWPRSGAAMPIARDAFAGFVAHAGSPDLTIDLHGGAPGAAGRVWSLTYDGRQGEAGLLAALVEGRTPEAAIVENGKIVARARLGTEYGGILPAAFEDGLARTITLILAAMTGAASAELPALPGPPPPIEPWRRPGPGRLAGIAMRKLAGRTARSLYTMAYQTPHWRTGWRRCDGPDLFDLRAHPATGWRDLADDGRRFYADPFPILHQGRLNLFVEEFAHAGGKGIISAVEFGADGPLGVPEPVLEQPGHLSYPFVFAADGEVWMIPESCTAGTVDLFRATAFPGGWVKHATLISGVAASDATLIEHDGLWWMFATVRDGGGAYSDALHLWSAPDFRGPWTPHKRNPVLIDIASARPAGKMVVRDGVLMRPVQDCRRGYGAALGLARVTRLDHEHYKQEVETILTASPLWTGRRLHTLNSAGGFEFIDGSGSALRRWLRPFA